MNNWRTQIWFRVVWIIALSAAGARGAVVPLSEDPAFATYYNGAIMKNSNTRVPAHSLPTMIECLGASGGPADIGAYWTLPATGSAGAPWTFKGWIKNESRTQLVVTSYAVLEIIFKTAQGSLIPYSARWNGDQLTPTSVWMEKSITALEPAGATEVSFYVRMMRDDVVNNGGVYFDSLSVLTPVPEPWVTGLLAVGMVGVVGVLEHTRRRRTRQPGRGSV